MAEPTLRWLAWRLAWREMRGSLRSFRIFLACLGLGVAAIAAVGQLAASLEAGLRRDAKSLLGGDFAVSQVHAPLSAEVLELLRAGGRVETLARMRAMASVGEGRATLTELKAVSGGYPLYGSFGLEDGGELHLALASADGTFGAVVERSLLVRLGLNPGEEFRIGEARFRIRGVIAREPDQAGGVFGLGPRIVISLEGFAATGLERPGSLITWIYPVRTQDGATASRLKAELRRLWPDAQWRIRETASASGGVQRFVDNLSMYLTLVGLISLLLGGVGAAGGVRNFLDTRLETIAVLKCLGAGRGQVVSIYLTQVLALALGGTLAGLGLGAAAAWIAGDRLAAGLGMSVVPGLYLLPLLTAGAFGLLTALGFCAPPLARAVAVSPARLFRGYADPGADSGSGAVGTARRLGWVAALTCAGLMLVLALAAMRKAGIVLGFGAGVVLAAALFRGLACGLAWGLRRLSAVLPAILPSPVNPRLAQALANIHRPGAPTASVVLSLGFGLGALACVVLIEGNMRNQIAARLPKVAPLYFLLDIRPDELPRLAADLERLGADAPGEVRFESQPSVRGRIVRIAGREPEERRIPDEVRWVVRGDRGLTYMDSPPPGLRLKSGAWWPTGYSGPPLLCLDDEVARGFGVAVGDEITVNVLGREITARIAATREIDWSTLSLNHVMIFSPGVLEAAPHTFLATVAGGPEVADRVIRLLTRDYPEVGAVYVRDVLAEVDGLLRKVALAIGAVSAFTLAVGMLVLSEALRVNMRARHHESVIFKVLGATRRDILTVFVLEFLILGGATALAAGVLGSAASWVFMRTVLRGEWVFLPWSLAGLLLAGAASTLLLGLRGVRSVLGRGSWTILRDE